MDPRTRIRSYFGQVVSDSFGDEEDIFARGLVDSMFGMQLVAFVEDEFAIVVEKNDLDIRHFSSIAALAAFVEAKLRLAQPEAGKGAPAE